MRIASDIAGMERAAQPCDVIETYTAERNPSTWRRRFLLLRAAARSDYLVIHFDFSEILFFAAAHLIPPFRNCRIVTLDFFVGRLQGARLIPIRWALGRVHRFLVYFKNSSIFENTFGLPASKFKYVPFKVNGIEWIKAAAVSDHGYIFCGGRSRRDFAALFAAVEPLGFPVKVVTAEESKLTPHGSTLAGVRIPPNVEIFTSDESPKFFVETMAASRLVVIPIVPDATTQAGISVYLQAMALGKCVIISASLGVSDVLTDQAVIVPPGDVIALRNAIERAWNDPVWREGIAEKGRRYALPLGGEDELRRSVRAALS